MLLMDQCIDLCLEAEICSWRVPSASCVYNTFVHIATPPIGVRGIQSAPGDRSLMKPTEAEDVRPTEADDMRPTEAEDETAVAAKKGATPLRAERNYRERNRKRKQASAHREETAAKLCHYVRKSIMVAMSKSLCSQSLPSSEVRSRGQALKRLRQLCLHVIPRRVRSSCAAIVATCASATYHASIAMTKEMWPCHHGRPSWRKEKITIAEARISWQDLRYKYDDDDEWFCAEMSEPQHGTDVTCVAHACNSVAAVFL